MNAASEDMIWARDHRHPGGPASVWEVERLTERVRHQLLVRALLDDGALLHDGDHVGVLDGGQPVGLWGEAQRGLRTPAQAVGHRCDRDGAMRWRRQVGGCEGQRNGSRQEWITPGINYRMRALGAVGEVGCDHSADRMEGASVWVCRLRALRGCRITGDTRIPWDMAPPPVSPLWPPRFIAPLGAQTDPTRKQGCGVHPSRTPPVETMRHRVCDTGACPGPESCALHGLPDPRR